MDIKAARTLCIFLMHKHNILENGWRFKFDNAKKRFGQCDYRKKTISLSQHLVELNSLPEVKDVILHEIAHALTPGHGHNKVWKNKAIEIGCKPERCYSEKNVITPEPKYVANCNGCGRTFKREKLKRNNVSCGFCSGGEYDETYKLVWEKNLD